MGDEKIGEELFESIPRKVENLIEDVREGRIGRPDLQRLFV